MDGPRDEHDRAVCRDGVYDIAVRAIQAALAAGFRVTTNTTLFNDADPERFREFFDTAMALGVEAMMLSPGYSYEKAPDQEHFLRREQTKSLFLRLLSNPKRHWRFNQSPLFLEFLKGKLDLECTPWGTPTYNLFGWQKPCYLLDEGYAASFDELMRSTDWSAYGRRSGNPKCQDCMVHCGHEPTAVRETFYSWRGFVKTAWLTVVGPKHISQRELAAAQPAPRKPAPKLLHELPVLSA
jgi:hopanoid biosynthesis associated radical SAM protein HpnH